MVVMIRRSQVRDEIARNLKKWRRGHALQMAQQISIKGMDFDQAAQFLFKTMEAMEKEGLLHKLPTGKASRTMYDPIHAGFALAT